MQEITIRQPLFPEEEKMPLAKYYYNYPVYMPDEETLKALENPMPVEYAIKPENWLDLLTPTGYSPCETGYCMFPDGSGYVATYRVRPASIPGEWERWYRNWRNLKSKSMVPGHGNLRYKIWLPADHFDHYYINWTNGDLGIFTTESLDLGQGERQYDTIRHNIKVKDYGFTDEKMQALKDAGINFNGSASFETFDEPGNHLCLSISRPLPDGSVETRSREWLGWRAENGKLVREERTHVSLEYMKKVVIHTLVEWNHLYTFLPDLYAEYKDQPMDAD